MALSSLLASASSALTSKDVPNKTVKDNANSDMPRKAIFADFPAVFFIQAYPRKWNAELGPPECLNLANRPLYAVSGGTPTVSLGVAAAACDPPIPRPSRRREGASRPLSSGLQARKDVTENR